MNINLFTDIIGTDGYVERKEVDESIKLIITFRLFLQLH